MKFVIVTPAYNEEKNIALTIDSVINQAIKPLLWVIVDDGSIDRTAEIIKQYASKNSWIQYVHREKKAGQTYFASNVYAIEKGVEAVASIDFDYLAILDADITLPADYYENIVKAFAENKALGIASGNCVDKIGDSLIAHLYDRRACAKAVMVFRRECYEQIGGFIPMKFGGEDTCACFMARMKGWKTWAYHEFLVVHNKPLGMGYTKNVFVYRFRQGIAEYFWASHPLFLLLKSFRRMFKESPYLIGGILRIAGFLYAHARHEKRQVSDELVRYIQNEQLYRVFHFNKIPEELRVNGQ